MNLSNLEMLQKGTISSIEESPVDKDENPTTARVLPCTADSLVTLPLTIQWWLRGEMGNLQVGDEVVYAMFEDGSGTIIARMDGNWNGHIHGDLQVIKGNVEMTEGDLTLTSGDARLSAGDLEVEAGDFTLSGNLSQTGAQNVSGGITAHGDVQGANVKATSKVSGASVEASGTVSGSEVSAGSISLTSHTHSTQDGPSGPPQ